MKEKFAVKDFTVSNESFPIIECDNCTLRLTQDVPNQESIGPYYRSEDYISHTNTSKGFINRLYQWVRRRTIQNKIKLVRNETGLPLGSILDIGSGTGTFVHALLQAGWQAEGLEPDPDARNMANKLYGVELKGTEVFMDIGKSSYDAITLWHVLEHVHDLGIYMQQLGNILKPGGRILIAVPNYTSKDAGIYKEFWAAYDVPRHLYHFSPRSMEELIRRQDLKLLGMKRMWYDSFYISLLSSKYKHGKPGIISAGWNGFLSNIVALFNKKKCSSIIYMVGK